MYFLALWHCTCHSINRSKRNSLGNSKKTTSCSDFIIFLIFETWKTTLDLEDYSCWKGGTCRLGIGVGNKLWLSWIWFRWCCSLTLRGSTAQPQTHLLRPVSCSFVPLFALLFLFSLCLASFFVCLFVFFSLSLLADLPAWWWILYMATMIPLLTSKVRLSFWAAAEDQESVPQAQWCSLWAGLPLSLQRGWEQQACPNGMKSGASVNFHTCPLLGVGFSHCFSLIWFHFSLPWASLSWESVRIELFRYSGFSVKGHTWKEESNGKRMEKIWIRNGKGEQCSLIIFPVQPGPLGDEVLLLVSGDKPSLPLLGTSGWKNAEEEGT